MTISFFAKTLREWYSAPSSGVTIGDFGKFGKKPWLFIKDAENLYYLNADTKHKAVGRYLQLQEKESDLIWNIVPNRDNILNKVAFGKDRLKMPGYYLYVKK